MANRGFSGMSEERRRQRRESRANQTWRAFVNNLSGRTGLDDENATAAAACVLCHLQERLTGDEAKDLGAQLPVRLRELLAEVCGPADVIVKYHKEQFVAVVARDLGIAEVEAEALIRGVFGTVRSYISPGEADDVEAQLSKDMRSLWIQSA
jgi:uncharacterized protein (DUF2267 family)